MLEENNRNRRRLLLLSLAWSPPDPQVRLSRKEETCMKKFINHPENAVEEMLQGLTALNPGSDRLPGHRVMFRADAGQVRDKQVAIISGGGSGHEPAHAGYIGAGMLSAA